MSGGERPPLGAPIRTLFARLAVGADAIVNEARRLKAQAAAFSCGPALPDVGPDVPWTTAPGPNVATAPHGPDCACPLHAPAVTPPGLRRRSADRPRAG